MSGPANKRIKLSLLEVTLDGVVVEVPAPLRGSLTAVHAYLESLALRRQSLLSTLTVDGVPIRLEKPMVPLKLFKRVDAVATRFDEFNAHLVPSLRKKLRLLQNRAEVAGELAMINEWPVAQRLWWDLLPDLKEPLLILSILAQLPGSPALGVDFGEVLRQGHEGLTRVLIAVDEAFTAQDPLALSDVLEQGFCVWLEQLDQALAPIV